MTDTTEDWFAIHDPAGRFVRHGFGTQAEANRYAERLTIGAGRLRGPFRARPVDVAQAATLFRHLVSTGCRDVLYFADALARPDDPPPRAA